VKIRIVAGIIALAIVFGAMWADAALAVAWCFGGLTVLGAAVSSYELCVMSRRVGPQAWTGLAVAGAALFVLLGVLDVSHPGWSGGAVTFTGVWTVWLGVVLLSWLVRGRGPEDIADVGVTIFAASYVGGLASYLVALEGLRFPPGGLAASAGGLALFWTLCTAKSADIFAYFTGKAIGRHKLAPSISPGKTIEGAIGGLCGSVVVGCALKPLVGAPGAALGWGATVVFAVCCSAACQLGDLVESRLKRRAGVKDSGALLPEYGGFLDMVDGLIFAAPVGYALLRWFGGAV